MDLVAELAFLGRVHAARTWMLDHARMRVATGAHVAGDRYTAETLGRMLKSYVKELAEEPEGAPFFGRLRFDDSAGAGDHQGQRYYIGRRRIMEEEGSPLVIDWRAPVSSLFYRASASDRRGVSVRRRYGWSNRPPIRLTGFEDEHLDRGEELGTSSRLLTEEIEQPRVGPMRDIVATIQPEQDELVRADLDQSLCVQGGPGTGKTAVGLHRAAYLLYAHRRQLKRTGVLVVGPNPAFLRYIAAVLPALGEVDVQQRTLEGLLTERPPAAADSDETACVKHDARMAEVVRRALNGLIRPPADGIVVADGSFRLRVALSALLRELAQVRNETLPYGLGRERFRTRIVALLQRQLEYHGESPNRKWLDRTARARPVMEVLDACWPRIRPEELLTGLLGDTSFLRRSADGILTDSEQVALRWAKPPRSFRSAKWSAADIVLLDEIAGAIQHPDGFGHIVVDEAQDLSPMQCRALARRSRHGSLTVLGDLAQGTTAWSAADWPAQLIHLGKPDAPVTALTLGFRVPASILSYANRLLPLLNVPVPAASSVRTDGELQIRQVTDLTGAVISHVEAALKLEGSIAVIATDPRIATLTSAALPSATPSASTPHAQRAQPTEPAPPPAPPSTPGTGAGSAADSAASPTRAALTDDRVTLLPATLAKGLEFDHVIVVEPAEIVTAEPRGLHRLYVVLTRAVSRLDVLHTGSPGW
jgi:DNA helicase IV